MQRFIHKMRRLRPCAQRTRISYPIHGMLPYQFSFLEQRVSCLFNLIAAFRSDRSPKPKQPTLEQYTQSRKKGRECVFSTFPVFLRRSSVRLLTSSNQPSQRGKMCGCYYYLPASHPHTILRHSPKLLQVDMLSCCV